MDGFRYSVNDYPEPGTPLRERPPAGYLPASAVPGDVPIPGWTCALCGSVVSVVQLHDDWHRRDAGRDFERRERGIT